MSERAEPELGWETVAGAFALRGETMRAHEGRSVVRLRDGSRTWFLKRFWISRRRFFKRTVSPGRHELRMIDWLVGQGFNGPRVVGRGMERSGPLIRRLFFVMEEVPGEVDLERYCRAHVEEGEAVMEALAEHTARLHNAGFFHHDFLATHILVGQGDGGLTFRLIDVERGRCCRPSVRAAATDLNKLFTSLGDGSKTGRLAEAFLDRYLARRLDGPERGALLRVMRRCPGSKRYGG